MSPYVRTVKTASGARAVQIVHSSRRGSRDIEHIGSAHDGAELEVLKAVARQRLADGQGELDLGLELAGGSDGGPLPITSSRMGHLWDALAHAYEVLGLRDAACGDEVFRQLVLARIIEPTSKLDSLRVLEEVGVDPPAYRTLKRRLPVFATDAWRQKLAEACARHAGYDLRVFFAVVGKAPELVTAADVLGFVTAQHTGGGADRLQLAGAGAGGVSARTVRRRLSSVSGLFGFLHARGIPGEPAGSTQCHWAADSCQPGPGASPGPGG